MNENLKYPTIPVKEMPFYILTAIFLTCLATLNLIGITKFVQLGPLVVAVGILPYPLTFLCTDLISEVYGRDRANFVVYLGLLVNFMILILLFLGEILPSVEIAKQPPWQTLQLAEPITLANGVHQTTEVSTYGILFSCTTSSVFASMVAYFAAQFLDVSLFHYIKQKTKGKHMWLRNNLSTLCSQLLDTVIVIGISLWSSLSLDQLLWVIGSSYVFKVCAALIDTPFFYWGVSLLKDKTR